MGFPARTTLGRTGISVSKLGLASGYGIDASSIEKAYEAHGINYFFWSTPRNAKMKAGLRYLLAKHRADIVVAAHSYDHLGLLTSRAVDNALRDLGTDYLDVLILGWHNSMPSGRVLEKAQALKAAGRIKAIGASGHNRRFFGELLQRSDNPIDVFMIRYNAAHPGAEKDIFPHVSDGRPGIVSFTGTSWRKLLSAKKLPAGEAPLTAAECYRFVLSNPNIDLSLFGPANEEQMLQGLKALEQGPLSEEEMARVRSIGKLVG